MKFANNSKIAKNLSGGFPYSYTKAYGRDFIARAMSNMPSTLKCVQINNQAVGAIGIHIQNDIYRLNAELGYWLAEDY